MTKHTATEVDIQKLFKTSVYDRNGQELAPVANVWVDEDEHPRFLGIPTDGEDENHIIPGEGAEVSSWGQKVRLAYDRDTVDASPTRDPSKDLSYEDERKVCDFFQGKGPDIIYPCAPAKRADYATAEEKDIPLSEEELVVGKREVGEGNVRLKKVVRSHTEEQPVELRHEDIVVDRKAGSGEPVSPESLGEQEYYIPLYHEEAVVQKQARERERVHVGKRGTDEREVVSREVREEELKDPEGPDGRA